MSSDLKPIHDWQFNKIKRSEDLERFILDVLSNKDEAVSKELMSQAVEKFGDYSQNLPLSEQVNMDDIHGWLEGMIHKSESRMSYYLSKVEKSELESMKTSLYEYGKTEGKKHSGINTPEDAYKVQNDCILEGMPCDKVNRLISADDESLVWENTSDIHEGSIIKGGSDIDTFHELRRSYISGLFDGMGFKYSFSQPEGKRINTISK